MNHLHSSTIIGTAAEKATLASVENGQYFYETDTNTLYIYEGGWVTIGPTAAGAPTTADYLVKTADAGLSAERVVTDTTSVIWDWGTAGQAKAQVTGRYGTIDPATLSPYILLDAEQDDANLNDGDAVGTAKDFSGNGRDLTQGTAGKKPTFKTGILNSKAVYRFDGGDCLQRASVAISTFTIACVFRASGAAGILYEQSADINANDGIALYGSSPSIISVKKGGVLSTRTGSANWAVQDEWYVLIHHYAGSHALHKFWLGNTWYALVAGTPNNPGTGTTTDTLNLGARNNVASLPMIGDIAYFVLITPSTTTANAQGMANFLQDRYNI